MIHRLIHLVELEPDRYKRMNMMREIDKLQSKLEKMRGE